MKITKKKATKAKARNKRVAAATKTTPGVTQRKPTVKAARGVRALASRRTAKGKFTKVIFNQIGGKECRRSSRRSIRRGLGRNASESDLT